MVLLAETSMPLLPKTQGVRQEHMSFILGHWSQVAGVEDWAVWDRKGGKVSASICYRADLNWEQPRVHPTRNPPQIICLGKVDGNITHWLLSTIDQELPWGPGISRGVYISEWLSRSLPRCCRSEVPGQKVRNTVYDLELYFLRACNTL